MIATIADLPTWVIYAGVGACLGALGAAVSWLLEGVGQKWTRLFPIVAIALTTTATRELVMPHIQTARLDGELAKFRWVETLKAEMPDEYARIASEFRTIPKSATSAAEAQQKGFEIMANFRKRHASDVAKASDEQLTEYMQAYLAVLKAVQSTGGAAMCADFAMKGAPALGAEQSAYQDVLDKAVSRMVKAVASSIQNPQSIDPATEDDWTAVAIEFVDSGGSLEELQVIGSEDYSSPTYCQAAIGFFQAIIDTPAPPGHRIRAEMAKGLAES